MKSGTSIESPVSSQIRQPSAQQLVEQTHLAKLAVYKALDASGKKLNELISQRNLAAQNEAILKNVLQNMVDSLDELIKDRFCLGVFREHYIEKDGSPRFENYFKSKNGKSLYSHYKFFLSDRVMLHYLRQYDPKEMLAFQQLTVVLDALKKLQQDTSKTYKSRYREMMNYLNSLLQPNWRINTNVEQFFSERVLINDRLPYYICFDSYMASEETITVKQKYDRYQTDERKEPINQYFFSLLANHLQNFAEQLPKVLNDTVANLPITRTDYKVAQPLEEAPKPQPIIKESQAPKAPGLPPLQAMQAHLLNLPTQPQFNKIGLTSSTPQPPAKRPPQIFQSAPATLQTPPETKPTFQAPSKPETKPAFQAPSQQEVKTWSETISGYMDRAVLAKNATKLFGWFSGTSTVPEQAVKPNDTNNYRGRVR